MTGNGRNYRQHHEGWLGFTDPGGGEVWEIAKPHRYLMGNIKAHLARPTVLR